MADASSASKRILGHPRGLYPLFFTEMWERLAFYTMLNVLLLYATDAERGGLGLTPEDGNMIYGVYLAAVYFTPFPGGMIADRFLGYRKAVLLGGLTMSAGLFLMSIPGTKFFVTGLCGLVIGNGFLKPNISVMVGNLYPAGDPKRDSGYNIFYMGINIGAFLASFVSSWVRADYGWLWTFRAASFGLLVGMVILLISWKMLASADQRPEPDPEDVGFSTVVLRILLPAAVFGAIGFFVANTWFPDSPVRPAVCGFLAGMIPVIIFFVRLGTTAKKSERSGLLALLPIYVAGGTFFMILHLNGSAMTQWARDDTARDLDIPGVAQFDAYPSYYVNAGEDVPRPDPETLLVADDPKLARMFGQRRLDTASVELLAQAEGISVKRFGAGAEAADLPEADRALFALSSSVYADGDVKVEESKDSHGAPVIAVSVAEGTKPKERVAFVRESGGEAFSTYVIDKESVDAIYGGYEERFGHEPELLPPGKYLKVIGPEMFQSLNALFVVAFTPLVVMFFGLTFMRSFSTAKKVFMGLLLTTLSLLLMAVAGLMTDGGALKVSGFWLAGFYAIVTLGELLLSPMGLSLVTKLTPKRLVGLAMGGWFLATAFGNNFSGFFGGIQHMMSPVSFFLVLAGLAGLASAFIFVLLPRLDAAIKECGG